MTDPGLSATTQPPIGADVRLRDVPVAPSKLWTKIVDTGGLNDCLNRALDDALSGLSAAQAQATLKEAGVSAMPVKNDYEGSQRPAFSEYRDWVVKVHKHRDPDDFETFVDLHREMGRGHGTTVTPYVSTQLQDIVDGPLALFAMADVVPTIVIPLQSEWFQFKRNQRLRWLDFVLELAEVADVVLATTGLTKRRLRFEHEEDLPTNVVNEWNRLHTSSSPPAELRDAAEQAREDISNARAWDLLSTLRETSAQRRAYREVHNDVRFGDVSRSARSHWVKDLRDADLVETPSINGEKHVVLLPAGEEALRQLEDDASSAAGVRASNACEDRCTSAADAEADAEAVGPKESTPDSTGGVASQDSAAVNDPPKNSAGPCVPKQARETPPGEAAAVAADSSAAADGSEGHCSDWMTSYRHHAAAAAAQSGGFVLSDEKVEPLPNDGDRRVSYDEDRKEIVVAVQGGRKMAHTAARLCAALLDQRLINGVLTVEALEGDGSDQFAGLDGLNIHVLRNICNIACLPNTATAHTFRRDLHQERENLLADLDLVGDGDYFDPEAASSVLSRAHGLMGAVTMVYDLLGWDIIREVRFPEYSRNDASRGASLAKFIGLQSAISSRYGLYTARRTMYEDRDDKREQTLGAPNVDPLDPVGDMMGTWVLRGQGIDNFREHLNDLTVAMEPQKDGENYAAFKILPKVAAATRRSTIAELLARAGQMKNLEPTRQAVSILHAVCGSVWDVSDAVSRLSPETKELGRDLDLQEIRFALSNLEPGQLLPSLGKPALSKLLSTLISADEPMSKAELHRRSGVSKSSISNHRETLEALGLVDVEETANGKANLYRVRLPFRSERYDDDAPVPRFVDPDDPVAAGGEWMIHDVVEEVLVEHGESLVLEDYDLWMRIVEGKEDVTAAGELWPWLDPLLDILAAFVDERGVDGDRSPRAPPAPYQFTVQMGEEPPTSQATL